MKKSVAIILAASLSLAAHAGIQVVSGAFTVDRAAPSAPVAVAPVDGGTFHGAPVTLEALATDAVSGVAAYRFAVNGVETGWLGSPSHVAGPLPDGANRWRAQARDAAGHEGPWSSLFEFVVVNGPDEDNDGLSDSWELTHFGRISFTSGQGDADGDGLADADEYAAGGHPYQFTVTVPAGWSMLALPFDATVEGIRELRASAAGSFWGWDSRRQIQIPVLLPEAGEGFWVYCHRPGSGIAVTGLPPAIPERALLPGWNMAGPGTVLPVAVLPRGTAVWDQQGRRAVRLRSDDFFAPLRGYWINCRTAVSLPLSSE